MRKIGLILTAILFSVFVMSCENDPCDAGFTQVDGVCVPDFVIGIEDIVELGDEFYHSDYGVITYKNGHWYTEYNVIIHDIDL